VVTQKDLRGVAVREEVMILEKLTVGYGFAEHGGGNPAELTLRYAGRASLA
jgi:hypothetical protein